MSAETEGEFGCFLNQTLYLPLKGLSGKEKKNLRADLRTYSTSKQVPSCC